MTLIQCPFHRCLHTFACRMTIPKNANRTCYKCWNCNRNELPKKTELKDHVQTAEHHQILYDKFHVLFKNIQRKIATKFLSTLVLWLSLEKIVCAKPNQKYLNILQYYSKGCSLVNRDTKDLIVMQIRLIATSTLSGY